MTNAQARPAHRPSRRASVIDAALGLFATYPAEEITVADIATAANMTAAAVYYHFPSKERVLFEGLQDFSRAYLSEVRRLAREARDARWSKQLAVDVLEWLDGHRVAATVFFARSAGIDMTIEALRRETRIQLVRILGRAVRAATPRRVTPAEAGVVSTALVVLLETAAASWLTEDAVFQGLGRRRFAIDTADLAERIVNPVQPS